MAAKNETVNVNVLIAERSYPLKVLKADEEKVKNAVRLVNDKIKAYQDAYAGKDKQDYMAMCLLNYAVESMYAEAEKQENQRFLEEKMTQLESILSGAGK